LVSKVGRLAQALVRGNPFAGLRPALDIFEREDSERLASLLYRHPRFSRLLDTPPTAGERPFATLADIALAASAVERAAAAIKLLTGLGIRPQHVSPEALVGLRGEVGGHGRNIAVDPATIDAGVLARTLLVGRMLGASSPGLSVLSPASIEKFKQTFNKANQADETAVLSALEILASASPEGRLDGPVAQVARRWVASLFPLGPVLGSERI
jgi:hypothetical protein